MKERAKWIVMEHAFGRKGDSMIRWNFRAKAWECWAEHALIDYIKSEEKAKEAVEKAITQLHSQAAFFDARRRKRVK